MTNQFVDANKMHPITPPPELVREWLVESPKDSDFGISDYHYEQIICTAAARWGADQELEACRNWIRHEDVGGCGLTADWMYEARRPKPPSLKEQALLAIDTAVADGRLSPDVSNVVRRALEQLDD